MTIACVLECGGAPPLWEPVLEKRRSTAALQNAAAKSLT
ncbi:hypothetical protein CfE428DRAFT_4154 [Chthoniobacter flavus Ellin428]|uniref:Uncharacterized protein n=1 Tax=Chthoniobacter flavus Ellin428 TaxID=497964 RepID=B4D5G5_9BACT|nr:hypothetical protein CfE428DRAFT_4154 [Chthoniobacter flavus Ellin428]